MKNTILITLLVLISLQSCKDDDDQPTMKIPNAGLVTTPNSYWVYDWYQIDSFGIETSHPVQDSIYIAGDTLLNGNTYVIYKGTELGSPQIKILRDSSGFIVDHQGVIIWNINSISQIADNTTQYGIKSTSSMTNLSSSVTVGAGTFNTIEKTTRFCYEDGKPFTVCNQCWDSKSYFSDGIGEISLQTAYIGTINKECTYLERRLIKYRIK